MNSNLQDTRLKIPQHLCKMLANEFFEIVPFNVAVIDKDSMIIIANKNFEDYFGNWVGKRCYEVYHHTEERCPNCKAKEVFEKGIAQVNDEGGYDRLGRTCHFVNHLAPVKDEKGVVQYVVEMCTDVVNSTMYQREYNILFERVPCYISIVDKEYRIVRANNKLRETFGEVQGKFCFEVFKKRKTPCSSCPAEYTFETGKESYSTEVGLSSSGEETHYVVNTSSFSSNSNGVSLILEIANDITEIALLQEQIKEDHDFYNTVLEDSKTAIIALNNRWKTQIFNAKAREILNWKTKRKPTLNILRSFLPKQFFEKPDEFGMIMNTKEIYLETPSGSEVPVLITALELKGSKNEVLGRVCFFEDISSNKVMSKQIEDSERFKIISQTVGGLSHTVRNLLISLEGSMFLVDSGLKKNDKSSVDEGWASLVQNYNKTSDTVKEFMNFAGGRGLDIKPINPAILVNNLVESYRPAASKHGVILRTEVQEGLSKILIDPKAFETCLTQLISNAIDSASTEKSDKAEVIVSAYEKNGFFIIEVEDNGHSINNSFESKISHNNVFENEERNSEFGLLVTKKIVQEHGGTLETFYEPDVSSKVRITLNKGILEHILNQSLEQKKSN